MVVTIGLAIDLFLRILNWYQRWNHDENNEQETDLLLLNSNPEEATWKKRKIVSFFLCFSPYSNAIKILSLPKNQDGKNYELNLACINGIRSLSLCWVILGHCYIFLLPIYDNLTIYQTWLQRFSFMVVPGGYYAVDSFLFLSGFMAYRTLSKMLDTAPTLNRFLVKIPIIYLHRYLRLVPAYLALILLTIGIWPHLSIGPLYQQNSDKFCSENWWANLLFINNLYQPSHMCVPWSWYLAVDMQIFLISPFLVASFYWKPHLKLGYVFSFLLIFIQITTAVILTFTNNLPSTPTPPLVKEAILSKNYFDVFNILYITPWCRLGPYVIGILTANLALHHSVYLKVVFNNFKISIAIWSITFALMTVLIFGQYGIYAGNYIASTGTDATYNAVARMCWAIALGWIVVACMFNNGGELII